MTSFAVRYTETSKGDLSRLFDFLLERAQTIEDLDAAQQTLDTLVNEIETHLCRSPFIYRKAGQSPFLRELIITFRRSGYVALYEIENGKTITIVAVRHQREDDYH